MNTHCSCPIASSIEDMAHDCDSDDTWVDWEEREVTLTKARRCIECSELLPEDHKAMELTAFYGDEYGEVDDDRIPDRFITCIPCRRIRESLYCGRLVIEQLHQLICNEMGFDYVTGENTWSDVDDEWGDLSVIREREWDSVTERYSYPPSYRLVEITRLFRCTQEAINKDTVELIAEHAYNVMASTLEVSVMRVSPEVKEMHSGLISRIAASSTLYDARMLLHRFALALIKSVEEEHHLRGDWS